MSATPWGGSVELTCQAVVAGQTFESRMAVDVSVYDDPVLRVQVERDLREQLLRQIMERWKPEIRVRR